MDQVREVYDFIITHIALSSHIASGFCFISVISMEKNIPRIWERLKLTVFQRSRSTKELLSVKRFDVCLFICIPSCLTYKDHHLVFQPVS